MIKDIEIEIKIKNNNKMDNTIIDVRNWYQYSNADRNSDQEKITFLTNE